MKFVAIDVETANEDMASICQIGLAIYVDGSLENEWSALIDPEDEFSGTNTNIHGISSNDVKGCPTFPEIADAFGNFINGQICVHHTHFDRVSIRQAATKYDISQFDNIWLDSASIARRVWPQFAKKGYGLPNICDFLGYEFNHHDALEDAKAAGHILLTAIKESGLDLDGWLKRVNQPINPSARRGKSVPIKRDANSDGHMYGEVMVFTGMLKIPRVEAADMALEIGCKVVDSVTKNTTILVVGDQDIRVLKGHEKSSKHRKAERLISSGVLIRIIRETDFKELFALAQ